MLACLLCGISLVCAQAIVTGGTCLAGRCAPVLRLAAARAQSAPQFGSAFTGLRRLTKSKERGWTAGVKRTVLPFGMRVPDHYLFSRDVTRGEREFNPGDGGGYGSLPQRWDPIARSVNHKNLTDRYRARGYSSFAEYAVSRDFAFGASALVTAAHADRETYDQQLTVRAVPGVFGRVRLTRDLLLLAEFDTSYVSRRALGYQAALQLDYQPARGLHLLCAGDVVNVGSLLAPRAASFAAWNDESALRPGGWMTVDWLFTKRLEARVDMTARQSAGQSVLAKLQAYF